MDGRLSEAAERRRLVRSRFKSAVEVVFQSEASLVLAHVNSVYPARKDGTYTLVVLVDDSAYASELMGKAELLRLLMFEEGFEEVEAFVSRGRFKERHPYLIDQPRIASEGIEVNWEFCQALTRAFPYKAPSILEHVNGAYVFEFDEVATLFVFVDGRTTADELELLGAQVLPVMSVRQDPPCKGVARFRACVSHDELAGHHPFARREPVEVGVDEVMASPIADFEEDPYSTMTFESFDEGVRNKAGFFMAYEFCLQRSNAWHNPLLPIRELFLFGDHGSGKTHLLRAIASKVKDLNPNARLMYVDGAELARALLHDHCSSYSDKKALSRSDRGLLEEARLADVLLIDDLEPGTIGSRAAADALEQRLRYFVCEKGTVVIASPCPPEDFGFGGDLEPLFRRMTVVELFGEREWV